MSDAGRCNSASVTADNDAYAACVGAFSGGVGGIVIAGTGSIGLAVVGGERHMVGGWGFQLGDHGSGAWVGHHAVRRFQLAPHRSGRRLVRGDDVGRARIPGPSDALRRRVEQRRFEAKNGALASLEQLVESGLLPALPDDPLRLGYELREGHIILKKLKIAGMEDQS